jgi:two-component system osmolarity sensor histidine kinase EnvZ
MRWPRTLFARNLLLLIVLLVVTQLVSLLGFRFFVQVPRLERLAGYVVEQEISLREVFAVLPPEQRASAIPRFCAAHPERLISAVNAPVWMREPQTLRSTLIFRPLQRILGADHPLHWAERQNRLWVGIVLDGRPYWMGFAMKGLLPDTGVALLLVSLLLMTFSVLGAILIQRHLHHPLRRLTVAADAVRLGQKSLDLPLDGPEEIARVAQSFQRMSEHLEQVERERALMLAGVSHDLRTPLAKLRLCTEMLRMHGEADLLDTMSRSIEAADRIIGQFVAYARIGSDEDEQLCDLGEIVRSVVAETGMATICRLQLKALEPLAVRPVALRRALANLLENARHYAPGMVDIELGESAGEIQLRVLDRGPGIPEEEQARVRQPFVRLDVARGRSSGTGLGLAIAERIAHLHGGRLELGSREGGGLIVTLHLPRQY